jgi:hypothetical protein
LDVLADDWLLALQAFGSSSLGALRLTVQAPCVPILLDVAHAFLERIAALSAEEMTEMPMLTQCHGVLADDRCFAMLASGSKVLVPVQMAVVAQPFITILCHRLAFNLWKLLSSGSSLNSVNSLGTIQLRLRTDFEGFQSSTTAETDETMWMKTFGGSTKCDNSSFDW